MGFVGHGIYTWKETPTRFCINSESFTKYPIHVGYGVEHLVTHDMHCDSLPSEDLCKLCASQRKPNVKGYFEESFSGEPKH